MGTNDRLHILQPAPPSSPTAELLTEIIGTFNLIGWIIAFGKTSEFPGPGRCPGRCIHQYEFRWCNRLRLSTPARDSGPCIASIPSAYPR